MKTASKKMTTTELNEKILLGINSNSVDKKNEAFALLFKSYKQMVFTYLSKNLRHDAELSKDLMMDVFTKIHLKLETFKVEDAALSTWIFSITKNTLIDYKRTKKYEILSIEGLNRSMSDNEDGVRGSFQIEDKSLTNNALNSMIKDERASRLLNALDSLKKDSTKKALLMFYFEGKKYAEISEVLGINETNVKALLHRGKLELKSIIGSFLD